MKKSVWKAGAVWMAVLGFGLGLGGAAAEERGKACLSSQDCPGPLACSTEWGACNPPPGCDPSREICAAVCYGTCQMRAVPPVEQCGRDVCPPGSYCCNPLQNQCVQEGEACLL